MKKMLRYVSHTLKKSFVQTINQNSFSTLICLKLNKVKYNEQGSINSKDYVSIYGLPFIRHVSILNRLKFYQTLLTSLSIPAMAILSQQNILLVHTFITGSIVASGLCVALHSAGYFTNNLIGFIYYNQQTEIVKISYADFWGNRKNIEIPVVDIVKLCDTKPTLHDKVYVTVQRYSTKETLKLNLGYGVIYDEDKFQKIF